MKKWFFLMVGLLFLGTQAVYASDAENGEQLHDDNCISCHKSQMGGDANKIYTRSDRKVKSFQGLKKQVGTCRDMLGLTWFDEEVDDVVAYLNQTFYHF